jgi:hypothetical protein
VDLNCQIDKFENRRELKKHIAKVLKNLDGQFEYNIFMHHINDYDEDNTFKPGDKLRKSKMESILKNGFTISRYASIFGTMILLGVSKKISADDIINYKYYHNDRTACCIFALPKYVNVEGKKVEFSSFNGVSSYEQPKELFDEYDRQNLNKIIRHHIKSCVFDAIKGFGELPLCYNLGMIYEDKNGKFYYINPHTHLSEKNNEELKAYNADIEKQILNAYEKFGTKNKAELIVKAYAEEEKYRDDDYLNFD